MVQQEVVVGVETEKIYYTGDAISCRRFINESAVTVKNKKQTHIESGFKEALRIMVNGN